MKWRGGRPSTFNNHSMGAHSCEALGVLHIQIVCAHLIKNEGCTSFPHIPTPSHLHDAGQLVYLILAWEQRVARVQFSHDATQAPHINGHVVGMTKDHFWGSVEPTLDIGVHCRKQERKIMCRKAHFHQDEPGSR